MSLGASGGHGGHGGHSASGHFGDAGHGEHHGHQQFGLDHPTHGSDAPVDASMHHPSALVQHAGAQLGGVNHIGQNSAGHGHGIAGHGIAGLAHAISGAPAHAVGIFLHALGQFFGLNSLGQHGAGQHGVAHSSAQVDNLSKWPVIAPPQVPEELPPGQSTTANVPLAGSAHPQSVRQIAPKLEAMNAKRRVDAARKAKVETLLWLSVVMIAATSWLWVVESSHKEEQNHRHSVIYPTVRYAQTMSRFDGTAQNQPAATYSAPQYKPTFGTARSGTGETNNVARVQPPKSPSFVAGNRPPVPLTERMQIEPVGELAKPIGQRVWQITGRSNETASQLGIASPGWLNNPWSDKYKGYPSQLSAKLSPNSAPACALSNSPCTAPNKLVPQRMIVSR